MGEGVLLVIMAYGLIFLFGIIGETFENVFAFETAMCFAIIAIILTVIAGFKHGVVGVLGGLVLVALVAVFGYFRKELLGFGTVAVSAVVLIATKWTLRSVIVNVIGIFLAFSYLKDAPDKASFFRIIFEILGFTLWSVGMAILSGLENDDTKQS